MSVVPSVRRAFVVGALLVVAAPAAAQTALLGVPVGSWSGPAASIDATPGVRMAPGRLTGRSGAIRAAVVGALDPVDAALLGSPGAASPTRYRWSPLLGTKPVGVLGEAVGGGTVHAPAKPGIWRLEGDGSYASTPRSAGAALALITHVPFSELRDGRLNGYRVGSYPARGGAYAPPSGFIEVTEQNQDFAISEHFRLRQFLTKDQRSVWPKYLALDLQLIDKLELVIQELNTMGVRADRMHVMSGYRTPQYNGPGGDGRAALSRHTYGDAADVWVDNDGNGYMDDLNGDGRADLDDARVILRAVDRVERRYPELIGGAGVYVANSAHGPFIHIDARGDHARW